MKASIKGAFLLALVSTGSCWLEVSAHHDWRGKFVSGQRSESGQGAENVVPLLALGKERGMGMSERRMEFLIKCDDEQQRGVVEAVNRFASTRGDRVFGVNLMASLLREADGSLERALEIAGEIADPTLRERLIEGAFRMAMEKDPSYALSLADRLSKRLRKQLDPEIGRAWAIGHRPAELADLLSNANSSFSLIQAAVNEWSEKKADLLLEAISKMGSADFLKSGYEKWEAFDRIADKASPEAMLRYLEKQPNGLETSVRRNTALSALVAESPDRFDEISSQYQSFNVAKEIASQAAERVVSVSTERATGFLQKIPGEFARSQAARNAATTLLQTNRHDPDKVFAWLGTVEDPLIAKGIYDALVESSVKVPKELAVRWRQPSSAPEE